MLDESIVQFISELSVFAGIEANVLELVGRLATRVECEDGEIVFREGAPAKEMVVVVSGRLDVFKKGAAGREACIASLGPGDVAGEMSLIDIQPRSAEVRAVGDTSLVVLTHGDIGSVYKEDPEAYLLLVRNIAREISLRLRRLDETLATLILEIGKATAPDSE